MRDALFAAFNPPPKPAIVVTQEMSLAGARAYNEYLMVNHQPVKPEERAFVGGVAAAFRAMRALEPPAARSDNPVCTYQGIMRQHRRIVDPVPRSNFHRRKDDE
jgi:hypothetical protein